MNIDCRKKFDKARLLTAELERFRISQFVLTPAFHRR